MSKALADAAFVVVALALLALAVGERAGWFKREVSAREKVVTAGTTPAGTANQENKITIAVYLSPTCRFCEESMPFYRELSERVQRSADTRLVFPVLGDAQAFGAYLRANGLNPAWAASLPLADGVPGTPTVVRVDPDGVITDSWAGRLNTQQEKAVLAIVD